MKATETKATEGNALDIGSSENGRLNLTFAERIRWIVQHWLLYRARVPFILLLTILNGLITVGYPLLFKRIIDGMQSQQVASFFAQQTGYLLALGVAQFVVYSTLQYLRAKLNLSFEFSVRLRAFESVTRMGQSFFGRFRTGDIVTRLMDDVSDKLSWYMCSGIFRLFEAGAVVVFCLFAMWLISPWLTVVAAGPLPILVVLYCLAAQRLQQRYDAVQQSISQLNESLENCFSGMRVVKSFTAEAMQRKNIAETIEANRVAEVNAVRWQTVIDTLWGNVWQLGIVAVLLVGGGFVMNGTLTLGDLVAFDAYVLLMVWPMYDFGQFLVRGKLCAVTIDRIAELERFPPDVLQPQLEPVIARLPSNDSVPDYATIVEGSPEVGQGGAGNHRAGQLRGDIVSTETSFRYATSTELTLQDLSFAAKPGEITALVGETGCGKSTALMLLPRLLQPSDGELTVASQSMADWDLVQLRQQIGYVPQEASLLSGSVEENIRFGRDWVTAEDIAMAIRISQLTNEIAQWPDGLQTVVGSRGVRISGGQKQRVSLARALAGRPSILLLDDCTASLDAETESAVWAALLQEIPNCTVLLVTHRPSTLRSADRIVLMEDGRDIETGSFDELNVEGTRFHQLYVRLELRARRVSS